ncbi:MAG TPA: sulfate ABC transporter substrate-binding protein [Solirubrobacterales bacterium]|nr:sulfate ABC transporter substrate-binding protein [Solirubrobacterales bacterium]
MRNARKDTRQRSVNAGLLAGLLALAIGLVVAGCGSSSSSGGTVAVVGYSSPQSVYEEGLESAFKKTSAGSGVSFTNSFGASGDQSRAVAAGQPADVVHFSIGSDMTRLVEEGQVASDWEKQPYNGIAQDSVVVLAVRKGNPDHIKSFNDLLSKKVNIITPNPFSSGSARWNIMAVYGSQIEQGKSESQALDAVKTVLKKTQSQPGSGRDAMTAFTQGQGDVLLTYENEAIKAEKAGENVEYVIPEDTIKIETPIAVTEKSPPQAKKFLEFIWSEAGQKIWAKNGYRPVDPKLVNPKQFPAPKGLFTIAKFGGWSKVKEQFFEEKTGSITKIEDELGVSTAS